jgi:hypothetical protein
LGTFHGLFEHLLESRVILVVLEDRHPRVGTVQNLVNQSTIGCSFGSSHAPSPAKPALSVKKRFPPPFLGSLHPGLT